MNNEIKEKILKYLIIIFLIVILIILICNIDFKNIKDIKVPKCYLSTKGIICIYE